MNRMMLWLPAMLAGAALSLPAQAPNKIAIIHLQNAIIGTRDGQKAAKELETKFMPKRQEIEKRQGEIQALQQQLRASSNTASEEQKNKLMRDIDVKQKALQRDGEDASAELDQEQQKLFQEIGGKVMAVIDKYATDNAFAVVIDVMPQVPQRRNEARGAKRARPHGGAERSGPLLDRDADQRQGAAGRQNGHGVSLRS